MGIGQRSKGPGLAKRALADALGNRFDEDLAAQRLEAGLVTLPKSAPRACHGAQAPGAALGPAQAAAAWFTVYRIPEGPRCAGLG
eukprot:12336181-Alexandrium_andersonii.AAC.1